MSRVWGGIEAGGTSFVCAVGADPDSVIAEERFPTTSARDTIRRAISFFKSCQQLSGLSGVGIASFGPLDLDRSSPTYGHITDTPKGGWSDVDILGMVQDSLGVPVAIDTDVNAAALAEHLWGTAQGLDTFIYLTVGTGIGGGGLSNGRLMHGLVHPEMGHIRVPHDLDADPYVGCCPYHGDCLEGLASGPAIERRWGSPPNNLPADHPMWELEARYLGIAVANYVCTLSPQRVVMGGGVMEQPWLISLVRRNVQQALSGYVQAVEVLERIDEYIVRPALGRRVGVLGALALARQARP